MEILTKTYKNSISFELGCYDRMILSGSLPEISYPDGITHYMYENKIRIFDYPKFAEPFKDKIKGNAERLAEENDIKIEFINKSETRKESLIAAKIKERGDHPGLVHILTAMELCPTYKPWHNKTTGKNYLKSDISKCLHYYFYFIDEMVGLGFVRVPTWCPFNLQVYVNGHNILASQLRDNNIDFTIVDNAFDSISEPPKAQELSDNLSIEKIHRKLDEFAWKYCPVYKDLKLRYHWSVKQIEYSTDIVFKNQNVLSSIYSELIATAIHTVKPTNIVTFLGKKMDSRYQGEIGNNYNVRFDGCRIKHTMGEVSIKMYDKFSRILRIETTTNNISFFKHYREVVHRDGNASYEMACLKKNIYSLTPLKDNLKSANKRYLEFISAFDNQDIGRKRLDKVTQSMTINNRNFKGFNFFSSKDLLILLTIIRGEFNIRGFRNKHLQKHLNLKSSQVSRLISRLRAFKIIKKAKDSYQYYLTSLGKLTIVSAQKMKEYVLVPGYC